MTVPRSGRRAERLLALFVAGWLLANYPLLKLATGGGGAQLFGWPLLPALLLIGWALVIAALAWVLERPDAGSDEPGTDP